MNTVTISRRRVVPAALTSVDGLRSKNGMIRPGSTSIRPHFDAVEKRMNSSVI